MPNAPLSLFQQTLHAIQHSNPATKAAATTQLLADWQANSLALDHTTAVLPITSANYPGRPAQPTLVAPREVPRRDLKTPLGKAAFIHAIAHIEFNAINLALDAVYRFRNMPDDYYGDWLNVAADEARHFQLLRGRLQQLGHDYGDFPAHNGLWEMAEKTAHDPLLRMALVPRVLEARGLDVTPGMIKRLTALGDHETVAILATILEEEIPHVATGSRWFACLCEQRDLVPETEFPKLLQRYMPGVVKPPFNQPARLAAGFTIFELQQLATL